VLVNVEIDEIVKRLKIAFKDDAIKKQVLEPEWLQLNKERGINSTGFCFSASEVLYRLTGGSDIWMVNSLNDPEQWQQLGYSIS
jgi:hypothetical protein